ncbi:MAG TPA: ABC transporter permease [Symbiobacteriaceae bacterium]|nr:ABC transporter permease [Symbiobacteriaceae bacterium]
MRNRLSQFLLIIALLIFWQAAGLLGWWPPDRYARPVDVAAALERLGGSGELLAALLVTLRRMLAGYISATLLGALLGLAMARLPRVSAVVSPLVTGLQALPAICWYPLAHLWLELDEGAILLVIAIGTLSSVASAAEGAIRTIPQAFVRAAATMGARGWRLYVRVILPAALPTLLTGMRAGWTSAWRLLMAAEMLGASPGLGRLLGSGQESGDAALVVALMLIVLAVGLSVDRLVFARAERAVRLRWGYEQDA